MRRVVCQVDTGRVGRWLGQERIRRRQVPVQVVAHEERGHEQEDKERQVERLDKYDVELALARHLEHDVRLVAGRARATLGHGSRL